MLYEIDRASKTAREREYEIYEKLFNGKHEEVFNVPKDKRDNYIVLNLLRKDAEVVADGLGKNPPRFIAGKNQEFIEELVFNNELDTQIPEISLAVSHLGDGFIAFDANIEETVTEFTDDTYTVKHDIDYNIHFIHPKHVEIVTDQFNKRKIHAFIVEGEFKGTGEEKDKTFYKQTIITKNDYQVLVWEKGVQYTEENAIASKGKYFKHDLNRFFITHIPNFRVAGQVYGVSDFADTKSIQKEINKRFSQLSEVFDKHGNPKLLMSGAVFDTLFEDESVEMDENGNKYINIGEMDVIRVESNGSEKPFIEMLTWDAKTEESLKLLETAIKLLMGISGVTAEFLGNALSGGNAPESSLALRIRTVPTANKIDRLKKYFDHALKDILYTIQLFELKFSANPRIEKAEKIDIQWKDFYPVDSKSLAEETATLKNAGIFDHETLLGKQFNLTQEQARKIIDKIKEDSMVSIPGVDLDPVPTAGDLDGNTE